MKGRTKTILCGAAVITGFVVAGLIVQKFSGSHSHVFGLLLGKLRYLGKLPLDPTKLPYETKVMWQSSFRTASLKYVLLSFSITLALGAITLIWSIFRIAKAKAGRAEIMLVYSALATFVLFLLVRRLGVFTVFFFAVSIGSLALVKGRTLKPFTYMCIVGCLIFGFHFVTRVRSTAVRPGQKYVIDVIHYIKENTNPDEAVLSAFELGPSIATYCHRPVILHSSFESKPIRDKTKEVYTSLYRSEEDFYQTCKRYGASLFVFQSGMAVNNNPESIRYIIGETNLRKDSAAAMFRFAPYKLKRFRLVHQNPLFRIFRVAKETEAGT